jgi:dolichyl-phosphate-mannose--protein O-mannosyl transferase
VERNKGYVLIVLTYLAQWLPWMGSPRISFAYHFYVDIPLICACTAIAMQRLWLPCRGGEREMPAKTLIGMYFAAVALAFAYFYPILSGIAIPNNEWLQRMWLHSWI